MSRQVHYVYGKCINTDYKGSGNPCPMCESKEVQRLLYGHDFVCSECGEPLHKVQPPKTFWDKYGKLIIVVIAVVVIGAAAFFIVKGIKNRPPKPEPVEQVDTVAVEKEEPVEEVKPVEEAKPVEKVKTEKTNTQAAPPASNGITKKDLGYAVYKGHMKNGKMNDEQATLTFKEQHVIDSRDPQKRVAEPGDYVLGEFVDGHLVQGVWYDSSNTVKQSILIGR